MKSRTAVLASLVAVLMLCAPSNGWAAPSPDLWARWQASDPSSKVVIDHGIWDRLLQAYLLPADTQGGPSRFSYRRVSVADRSALKRYLGDLQALRISVYNREEQRAFWINLYNAATVDLVLDHYPVASIRDIKDGGLFSTGPWDEKRLTIEGVGVSLNDIEHRILRPIWRDPRLHYAINCASVSCPNLQPQAFTTTNTEALLEKGASEYINSPRAIRFVGQDWEVSSLYQWFLSDFGGHESTLLLHWQRYASESLRLTFALHRGRFRYSYNWSLNE